MGTKRTTPIENIADLLVGVQVFFEEFFDFCFVIWQLVGRHRYNILGAARWIRMLTTVENRKYKNGDRTSAIRKYWSVGSGRGADMVGIVAVAPNFCEL